MNKVKFITTDEKGKHIKKFSIEKGLSFEDFCGKLIEEGMIVIKNGGQNEGTKFKEVS